MDAKRRSTRQPRGFPVKPNIPKMREIHRALQNASSTLTRHFDAKKATPWHGIANAEQLKACVRVLDDLMRVYMGSINRITGNSDDD